MAGPTVTSTKTSARSPESFETLLRQATAQIQSCAESKDMTACNTALSFLQQADENLRYRLLLSEGVDIYTPGITRCSPHYIASSGNIDSELNRPTWQMCLQEIAESDESKTISFQSDISRLQTAFRVYKTINDIVKRRTSR